MVGEHRFRVDASTGRETTVKVRTERRAVTVEVVDCTPPTAETTADESRPDGVRLVKSITCARR